MKRRIWWVLTLCATTAAAARGQSCQGGDANVGGQCIYAAAIECRTGDAVVNAQVPPAAIQLTLNGTGLGPALNKLLVCSYSPARVQPVAYTGCLAGETAFVSKAGINAVAMCGYAVGTAPKMVSAGCRAGERILQSGRCGVPWSLPPQGGRPTCPAGFSVGTVAADSEFLLCVYTPSIESVTAPRSCILNEVPFYGRPGLNGCAQPASAARASCRTGESAYAPGMCAYVAPFSASMLQRSAGCKQGEQILGDGSCVYTPAQGANCSGTPYGSGQCKYTAPTIAVPSGQSCAGSDRPVPGIYEMCTYSP